MARRRRRPVSGCQAPGQSASSTRALNGLKDREKPRVINTAKAPTYAAALTKLKKDGRRPPLVSAPLSWPRPSSLSASSSSSKRTDRPHRPEREGLGALEVGLQQTRQSVKFSLKGY